MLISRCLRFSQKTIHRMNIVMPQIGNHIFIKQNNIMSTNLHTARNYQVEYTPAVIYGWESNEVLDLIFSGFEISTNRSDEYDDEFDMSRSELVRLRDHIVNRTDYYKAREEFLKEELSKIRLTVEEFVEALDRLITTSDQSNDDVLLSWY